MLRKKGKSLSLLAENGETILIYIINPSQNAQYIWQLCEMFQNIFSAYASSARTTDNPSDLVLQILPFEWAATDFCTMTSSLQSYTRMAKILYDKCPLSVPSRSAYASGAAFQIAEQIPRKLDFKLTASNSYSPLKHSSTAHLGYCWNEGEDWLSAALVNDTGNKQWNASYHVGRVSYTWHCFAAVAREIWEVVGEAIDFATEECRVYIAKTEAFAETEIESMYISHSEPIFDANQSGAK